MRGAVSSLPNTISWRGAQLKHRDNFIFTLTHSIGGCVGPRVGLDTVAKKYPITALAGS
jgi:hypothetical protein